MKIPNGSILRFICLLGSQNRDEVISHFLLRCALHSKLGMMAAEKEQPRNSPSSARDLGAHLGVPEKDAPREVAERLLTLCTSARGGLKELARPKRGLRSSFMGGSREPVPGRSRDVS